MKFRCNYQMREAFFLALVGKPMTIDPMPVTDLYGRALIEARKKLSAAQYEHDHVEEFEGFILSRAAKALRLSPKLKNEISEKLSSLPDDYTDAFLDTVVKFWGENIVKRGHISEIDRCQSDVILERGSFNFFADLFQRDASEQNLVQQRFRSQISLAQHAYLEGKFQAETALEHMLLCVEHISPPAYARRILHSVKDFWTNEYRSDTEGYIRPERWTGILGQMELTDLHIPQCNR